MMQERLTLITPTHNRSNFMRRLLRYLDGISFPCRIAIIDSSDPSERLANQELAKQYGSRLLIDYSHHQLGFLKKCCVGVNMVQTSHIAFCADDDFFFLNGAIPMVQFLEENRGYTSVQGQVVLVSNSHKAKSSLYDCELMKMVDISQETAAERLKFFADRAFSTFYGVHRTKTLQDAFDTTDTYTCYDKSRAHTEGMLLALSVIQGKVKTLSNIHYLQETHGSNESCVVPRTVDRASVIEHHNRYQQGVAKKLMQYSDITEKSAYRLAIETSHLVPGFKKRRFGPRAISGKLKSEAGRLLLRCSRLIDSLSPAKESAEHAATIRSTEIFPKSHECNLALKLLQEYPTGIPPHNRMAG